MIRFKAEVQNLKKAIKASTAWMGVGQTSRQGNDHDPHHQLVRVFVTKGKVMLGAYGSHGMGLAMVPGAQVMRGEGKSVLVEGDDLQKVIGIHASPLAAVPDMSRRSIAATTVEVYSDSEGLHMRSEDLPRHVYIDRYEGRYRVPSPETLMRLWNARKNAKAGDDCSPVSVSPQAMRAAGASAKAFGGRLRVLRYGDGYLVAGQRHNSDDYLPFAGVAVPTLVGVVKKGRHSKPNAPQRSSTSSKKGKGTTKAHQANRSQNPAQPKPKKPKSHKKWGRVAQRDLLAVLGNMPISTDTIIKNILKLPNYKDKGLKVTQEGRTSVEETLKVLVDKGKVLAQTPDDGALMYKRAPETGSAKPQSKAKSKPKNKSKSNGTKTPPTNLTEDEIDEGVQALKEISKDFLGDDFKRFAESLV